MDMSNLPPSSPKFKFFLRRLTLIPQYTASTLNKVRLRRPTFRKIYNEIIYEKEYNKEPNYNQYLPKQTLKYLTYVQLTPHKHCYWTNAVKSSKNLRNVQIQGLWSHQEAIPGDALLQKIKSFVRYLKNLPKDIQAIQLCANTTRVSKKLLHKLYRIISRFRKLISYSTAIEFVRGLHKPAELEFDLIRQYMARLPKIKEIEYDLMASNQKGVYQTMKKGHLLPNITNFGLHLWGDDLNEGFQSMPFYNLHLFSNLQKLTFDTFCCDEPFFDSSLVQGFAALSKLKELKLLFAHRSKTLKFIFEGMLHLPLLKLFSLESLALEPSHWTLLNKFLNKQTDLESLSLACDSPHNSHEEYLHQNKSLEKLWQPLEENINLHTLALDMKYTSVESICNALGHLKFMNQLKHLRIAAIDDWKNTSASLQKRVQGLCDIIKRQKGSLKELIIEFPYVHTQEMDILSEIAESVAEVDQIVSLTIKINQNDDFSFGDLEDFLKNINDRHPQQNEKKKKGSNAWPNMFAKSLSKLTLLQDLTLRIDLANHLTDNFAKDFGKMFIMLSALPSLKYLCFQLPEHKAIKKIEPKIKATLLNLKSLRYITFGPIQNDDRKTHYSLDGILEIVENINLRQSLKYDILSR